MGWEYEPGGRGWYETPSLANTAPMTTAAEFTPAELDPAVAETPASLEDILTAHGIVNAAAVIELAEQAGLELAAAAVLLDKESGGGHAVWGHDAVNTAGTYIKGAPVTQADYLAYRTAVQEGRIGRQGVGPCQLTWSGYQDQADRLGGCWDWHINCTVGFGALAGAIRTLGLREGFRSFNGSGPAAERYADDAMARLGSWRQLLHGASTEGDDMTPEQAAMLADLHTQLCTPFPGWAGGVTDDKGDPYTALQYLMRIDVEAHQANETLGSFSVGEASDFGQLSSQDVTRIAQAVLDLLLARLAPPTSV